MKIDSDYQGKNGHAYTGNVIYLSTFSKTLAPGLRLGWVVAPVEVIQKLVQAKQGTDLHTSTFDQMVAYQAASGGFVDEHVRQLRKFYAERRDCMLAAIARHFPPAAQYTKPEGGLFLWVTLPESLSTVELLPRAIEQKVAFVPGAAFYPDGCGKNTMRLNFSNATLEQIEEGIRRLGAVLAEAVDWYG